MTISLLARDGGTPSPTPPLTPYYVTETLKSNCEFTARDGSQLVFYDGLYHLLGGWNIILNPSDPTINEHWTSPDGVTWTQLAPPWVLPRHTFIAQVYDSKIWVMLNDPYNNGDKSMYTYTTEGGWISHGQLSIPDNQNLYFQLLHTDADDKQWIYFGGGQKDIIVTPGVFNNYMHRWDGTTLEKTCDFPGLMGARSNSVAWSHGGNIYVAGGGEYYSDGFHTYSNEVWISEDDGATFSLFGSQDLYGRQYANVQMWENKLYYLDGSNMDLGGNQKGLYVTTDFLNFSLVNNWGAVPARHASGMCLGNEIHIAAGNMWNDSYRIAKYMI